MADSLNAVVPDRLFNLASTLRNGVGKSGWLTEGTTERQGAYTKARGRPREAGVAPSFVCEALRAKTGGLTGSRNTFIPTGFERGGGDGG